MLSKFFISCSIIWHGIAHWPNAEMKKKIFFLNLRAGGFFDPYHMLIQFAKGFALVIFCTNSTATSPTKAINGAVVTARRW